MSVEEYEKKLIDEGWKPLGDGLNSVVYEKEGVVLKVSVNDYGYDLFLSWAMALQHNPYFPRIYQIRRWKTTYRGREKVRATVVLMEKLEKPYLLAGEFHSERLRSLGRRAARMPWYGEIHYRAKSKDEREAVRALKEMFVATDSEDLHDGNVMFRDKQPVIIDPVVMRYDCTVAGMNEDFGSFNLGIKCID